MVRTFAVSAVHSAAIMTGQVKLQTTFDVAVQRAQSTAIKAVVWCILVQCVSPSEHSDQNKWSGAFQPDMQAVRAQPTSQSTVNQSKHSQSVRPQSISVITVNQLDHSQSTIRQLMQSSVAA